jgi:DNA-binding SARP family transcriptional activator
LHGAVHALRAVIDPGSESRSLIESDGLGYRLCADERVEIDLAAFRQALAELKALTPSSEPSCCERVEAALERYGGELFQDEEGVDWCLAERAAVAEQAVEAMARLAALYHGAGRAERAVSWLRRAVRQDPFRDDLHRELIAWLQALGRVGEAAREARRLAAFLHRELGVAPER